MHFNINLTSLAVILWSGMLVIAGSIWVLSSQVRKVADLIEQHSERTVAEGRLAGSARPGTPARRPRAVVRRGAAASRIVRAASRDPLV
jgi:hypothetical protein